jgi:hypothetical protein
MFFNPVAVHSSASSAMVGRDRDCAFVRHHVAAREDAGTTGHHVRTDDNRAVGLQLDAPYVSQETAVGLLPERQHHRIGFERLDLPCGLWPTVGVELHHLNRQ